MVREKKNSDKGAAGDCSTDAGTLLLRTIKEHRQVIKRPSFFPQKLRSEPTLLYGTHIPRRKRPNLRCLSLKGI